MVVVLCTDIADSGRRRLLMEDNNHLSLQYCRYMRALSPPQDDLTYYFKLLISI